MRYIDILPENILQPWDTDYEFYKCRTNFFHRVQWVIAILIKRNELATDDESISAFLHYMGSDRDWHAKSTVADINFVNKILDHVISILNSSKSEES